MLSNFKKDFSPPAKILLVDEKSGLRQEFRECFAEFTITEISLLLRGQLFTERG